jgi:hypothetical protein
MTAPVASGWSVWPGGAFTHWKSRNRRLREKETLTDGGPDYLLRGFMGHVANAIGWLTVAIAVAIVSLQITYLLSADSIANPLPNKSLIDVTSAVILPTGPKDSVFVAPRSERAASCDSFRIANH